MFSRHSTKFAIPDLQDLSSPCVNLNETLSESKLVHLKNDKARPGRLLGNSQNLAVLLATLSHANVLTTASAAIPSPAMR